MEEGEMETGEIEGRGEIEMREMTGVVVGGG